MVLGIIALATAVPTIIGVNEATKGTQDHEQKRRDANRKARVHLISTCELTAASGRFREQIQNAKVVLRDGYVSDAPPRLFKPPSNFRVLTQLYLEKELRSESHPFTGVYHNHPDFAPKDNMLGLVSTVSKDPPLLRWIFVDSKTFEVRYGGKADSEDHIVGPWFVISTFEYFKYLY
jgi:hypothetical protein